MLWVQRRTRKDVLPALHDIVACMSSRCDATHRTVVGDFCPQSMYIGCAFARYVPASCILCLIGLVSLTPTLFKGHKAGPAVLGVIVPSSERMQLLTHLLGWQAVGCRKCIKR